MSATHATLIYESDRHYATEAAGFLRAGLERGDRPLVMSPPSRMELLSSELGRDADDVTFVDEAVAYAPQWNVYRVFLDFAAAAPDVRSCVVAEQRLARRTVAELVDYRRLESAANLVFSAYPVDMLCPYDAGLPAHLLDIAVDSHDRVLTHGAVSPNAGYRDPMDVLSRLSAVVPPPAGATTFDCSYLSDLTVVRRFVRAQGAEAGIDRDVIADVELAVTEVLTNAMLHGSPPTSVHLYPEGPMWVCHVQDGGGLPVDPLSGVVPPDQPSDHGYGLWLARQLVSAVDVGTNRTGTHVRLHTRAHA